VTGTDLKQRLAAILAADVAGYSRLMAMDERATVTALDAARAVFRMQIESNQGTSHRVFVRNDGKTLSVPARRPIKPIYVKKFLELVEGA